MAGVTYLVRVIPFVLVREEITNVRVKSFLNYMPYAVLSCMTIPAIFFATSSFVSALAGFVVALILALRNRGLLTVAVGACVTVFLTEALMTLL